MILFDTFYVSGLQEIATVFLQSTSLLFLKETKSIFPVFLYAWNIHPHLVYL